MYSLVCKVQHKMTGSEKKKKNSKLMKQIAGENKIKMHERLN